MSIFGYPIDSWIHTGNLVFLSLRARQYTRGYTHKVALRDWGWSQYWASWTPKWIEASQWLMYIFEYPMVSKVHTGYLVFVSHRARKYTWGDLRKKGDKIGFDHNIGQTERHSGLPLPIDWCLFSGTLWTHESTLVLGVPESFGREVHKGGGGGGGYP